MSFSSPLPSEMFLAVQAYVAVERILNCSHLNLVNRLCVTMDTCQLALSWSNFTNLRINPGQLFLMKMSKLQSLVIHNCISMLEKFDEDRNTDVEKDRKNHISR